MKTAIIPLPVSVKEGDGAFVRSPRTTLYPDAGCRSAAELLSLSLPVDGAGAPRVAAPSAPVPAKDAILLRIAKGAGGGSEEGYRLSVTPGRILLEAEGPAGAARGCQTLLQLVPDGAAGPIPCVEIEDGPRFPWRGLMLDTSRHFFSVDFILRSIDLLAFHRMNVFHWHLTDDQGWRVEIARYPRLTEIGAWRRETIIGNPALGATQYDGTRHGGFYTQAEVRSVVAYAAARHVTVVPEIEMPGHALSALAAYPELSCTGGPFEVCRTWGIQKDVFCPGNDRVFELVEGVLGEIVPLFPGRFVHIGGDECPKDRWRACPRCQDRIRAERLGGENELQSWFVRRVERILNGMGKRLIGWDEILEGGLAPNAAVMSWRGIDGGIAAATAGHDAVMSPHTHCYLDHYQTADTAAEPLTLGGCTTVEKAYSYEPVPDGLTAAQAAHILGVQGNLWTEYIATPDHADYMTYPRACALAEAAWTPAASRRWDDFRHRLPVHLERLDRRGVRYRRLDA